MSNEEYRPRDVDWKKNIQKVEDFSESYINSLSKKDAIDIFYACEYLLMEELSNKLSKSISGNDFLIPLTGKSDEYFDWFVEHGTDIFSVFEEKYYKELEVALTKDDPYLEFSSKTICAFKFAKMIAERYDLEMPSSVGIFEVIPFVAEVIYREYVVGKKLSKEKCLDLFKGNSFRSLMIRFMGMDDVLLGIIHREGALEHGETQSMYHASVGYRYKEGIFVVDDDKVTLSPEFYSKVRESYEKEKIKTILPDKKMDYREINRGCPFLPSDEKSSFFSFFISIMIEVLEKMPSEN